MTQIERVLSVLSRGHTLTARQASRNLNIDRLAARCYDLRQRGHDVRATRVEKNGKTFARYWLAQ